MIPNDVLNTEEKSSGWISLSFFLIPCLHDCPKVMVHRLNDLEKQFVHRPPQMPSFDEGSIFDAAKLNARGLVPIDNVNISVMSNPRMNRGHEPLAQLQRHVRLPTKAIWPLDQWQDKHAAKVFLGLRRREFPALEHVGD